MSWSGTDNTGGSGVASFSIFVSDDSGAFTPLLSNTSKTTTIFTGQIGHTYGFYSIATDFAGNQQPVPAAAQATTFIVAATPTSLVFGVQPINSGAGQSLSPAVTVQVVDQFGSLVAGDTQLVTRCYCNANPGGSTLGGTLTVQAAGGIAVFNGVSLNKEGTGYTLTAIGNNLNSATSNPFAITASTANHLAFLRQPSNTTAHQPDQPGGNRESGGSSLAT